MKNYILLLALLLTSVASLHAQNEVKYLLDGKIKVSAMGGPITEFSSADNRFSVGSGGFGALLFNNKIFVGGYGVGTNNNKRWNVGTGSALSHGGFLLGGYLTDPKKMLHWGLQSQLGWGTARWEQGNSFYRENVFVLSPQALLECNVTKWFRFNVSGGYRAVISQNTDASRMNSPVFGLGFVFGWFSK